MKPNTDPGGRDPAALDPLRQLVEKHARIAVLQVQHQGDAYQPTADEANLLKNMRHILMRFADELEAVLDGAAPHLKNDDDKNNEEKNLARMDKPDPSISETPQRPVR